MQGGAGKHTSMTMINMVLKCTKKSLNDEADNIILTQTGFVVGNKNFQRKHKQYCSLKEEVIFRIILKNSGLFSGLIRKILPYFPDYSGR